MSDPINLADRRKKAEPSHEQDFIWRCNCGCATYFLHADGEAECAVCETRHTSDACGEWRKPLPDTPEDAESFGDEVSEGLMYVTDMHSTDAAIQRVAKLANKRDTAALILIQKDGNIKVWRHDAEGEKQVSWLKRRMKDAAKLVLTGFP